MRSLQSFSRVTPRVTSRFSTLSARTQFSALRSSNAFTAPLKQSSASRFAAAFSTSRPSFGAGDSSVNQELAAKLQYEKDHEVVERDAENYSGNLKEYIENSEFKLHDEPGVEEVTLTRKYGNENIKVTFTVADINNLESDPQEEDRALFDEEDADMDGQSGGANTKGAVNQSKTTGGNVKVAPEDSVAPADRPELDDEQYDDEQPTPGFAARVNVTITRDNKPGALMIECMAQDGDMLIENIYCFPDAELADAKTAEKDWARRGLYTGPPFGNLDDDLQILFERYLDERGVNTGMALFVPDYIDFKEQKEYIRWLDNVKAIVEP
ncbi:mitochondrial glyco protein [Patellaria atrata CBS 101060]|uniref:Mitochondrial glyco protein n=1 Tax=Patellaria atrata CBS 101060 TaxID=1346257 RepID=A0A9P4VPA9_9PEZI|nr:mitochondrial glyco protein [Patellaria atrata CBS 101060]